MPNGNDEEKGLVLYVPPPDEEQEEIPFDEPFDEPIEAEFVVEEEPEEEEFDTGEPERMSFGREPRQRQQKRRTVVARETTVRRKKRKKRRVASDLLPSTSGRRRGLPAVKLTKGTKALYVPSAKPEGLYVPTQMRKISSPPSRARRVGVKDIAAPLRKVAEPELGTLRSTTTLKLTSLRYANSPQRLSGSPVSRLIRPSTSLAHLHEPASFSVFRRLTMPPGLSEVEKAAYLEIRANGDIDVPSHVRSELAQQGYSRTESDKAIKELLQRKIVQQGKKYGSERELEVVQ